MNTKIFKQSPLAASLALLLGSTISAPLMAQQTDVQAAPADGSEVEVIQIQGIRGSLMRSMDLKRASYGVVDAISAEEMGKFPDTNLAESLQRITGVSVSRSNGEGSQITVRGFGPDFNLITLNGRQMPGTGFTRSYNLENLSSEGVQTLELHKTARAENPSGGLGATVNIITTKPFTNPGQHFSVSGKGIHDTSVEAGNRITPELAAVYSNTFADDRIGIALSISSQRRDFQRQEANIQGWQANVALPDLDASEVVDNRADPDGNYFFPKDMNYSISDLQRERTNGQLTLQFKPVEGVVATLDYTASKAITGEETVGWGIWNEYGGNINAYELDENGTAVYADISGNDGSFTASRTTTEVKARSLGVNLKWDITDSWRVSLDYHDSSNETDNGADAGLGSSGQVILGSPELITKIYDYRSGEIPHAEILWNNGTNELTPGEIDSNFSQFTRSPGKSEIQQLQFDATWINSSWDIPLVDIRFGLARTEQKMSGYTAWSGLRGGAGFNPSYTQIFPDSMFVRHDTSGLLDAFDGGGADLSPHYYYTFDFDEAVARQLAYITADAVGTDNAYSIDPFYDGIDSTSLVEENTNAAYIQSQWEFDIAGFMVQLNAGVRYEETEVPSSATVRAPLEVNWVSASEWITTYDSAQPADFTGKYDLFLPMFDLKVDVTDDLVARLSWGKSITRAPLGILQGGRSFSGSPKPGSRTVSEGNTSLLPYESTNLDLSLEYYYDESSYASIGYFRKSVENFISTVLSEETYDGLHDVYNSPRYLAAIEQIEGRGEQATSSAIYDQMVANGDADANGVIHPLSSDPLIVWTLSKPRNINDTKTVDGFEIALQHVFGASGFGVGANATFVDGDNIFDNESLEVQTPLVGISDSANFQAFYEKDGLSVKVTYAWRDSYLIGVGQSQGSSDAPPQYAKAFGQWDMSVNYDIDEHLTVFFEGVNLNDETEQGYGRYQEQFLFARQYGPRYTLGARLTF